MANKRVIPVTIDIKPGSFPNSINVKKDRTIAVAILSSATFDAPAQVNRGSLTFGRTGDEKSLVSCNRDPEDVNKDKFPDLVCFFGTQAAGFRLEDTQAILKGRSVGGNRLTGSDSVRIVQ